MGGGGSEVDILQRKLGLISVDPVIGVLEVIQSEKRIAAEVDHIQ